LSWSIRTAARWCTPFWYGKEDGLTDHIMGSIPYQKTLKKSLLDNLSIVTSGTLPPNPSELLGSKALEEFIEKLKADFESLFCLMPAGDR
jgi:Mrp family chromosome partitioning ATPase